MHLLAIFIKDFRSISNQWLPADGLVVLFGANSAGKTSVLEAAVELLTAASSHRVDPGEPWDEDVSATGTILFTLPDAGISGSPGAELYAALLTGEHAGGQAWEWLATDAADLLRGKAAGVAREWIASRLVEAGRAGLLSDREILARSVLDPAFAYFAAGSDDVYMHATASWLPGDVIEAAHRIAADTDHDDVLWRIADSLATGQPAQIGLVADRNAISDIFPRVIVLDGDAEALSAELVKALPVIHDRLWDSHDPDLDLTSLGGRLPDVFSMGTPEGVPGSVASHYWPSDRYFFDNWLEQRSDSAEAEVAVDFEPYGQAAVWSRVRQSIHATAAVIEDEANRVAPGFLRDQGRIGVEVLPVSVWGSEDRRIRVTFTGRDREHRDLRVVGAGTARWAAAAVQLACRRLATGRQVVTDQDGAVISDRAAVRDIVVAAQAEPLSQATVRLEPAEDAPGVYVIDEPEAHLHPAAIASVRAWLEELARTAATVLAATHSPMLLDTDSALTTQVLVRRPGDGETELQALTGIQDDRLTEVASELGITKGDLLLMTRLAVFVEGPQDAIVLGEWFGNELRDAGIRVFPAHGGDNFQELATTKPGLVGSEIIGAMGIRIAVISDRSPNRVEPAVKRLLREAKQEGAEVTALTLSEEDVLFYLDEQVCRNDAPDFPGWHAARDAARSAERHDRSARKWKKWVSETYRLELSLENIRRLAEECKRQERIPAELIQNIKQLTVLAASTRTNTKARTT